MHKPLTLHTPQPSTTLPAHEREARRRRAADAHLPAIPGRKPRVTPHPAPRHLGRKTADLRDCNCPNLS